MSYELLLFASAIFSDIISNEINLSDIITIILEHIISLKENRLKINAKT